MCFVSSVQDHPGSFCNYILTGRVPRTQAPGARTTKTAPSETIGLRCLIQAYSRYPSISNINIWRKGVRVLILKCGAHCVAMHAWENPPVHYILRWWGGGIQWREGLRWLASRISYVLLLQAAADQSPMLTVSSRLEAASVAASRRDDSSQHSVTRRSSYGSSSSGGQPFFHALGTRSQYRVRFRPRF